MRNLLLLSLFVIGISSCKKDEVEPQYSTARMEAETKIDTFAVHSVSGTNLETFKALAFIMIVGTDYKYTSPEVTSQLQKPISSNEKGQKVYIATPGLKPLEAGQTYGILTATYRSVKPSFPTRSMSTGATIGFDEANNWYRITTGNGSVTDEIK